MPVPQPSARMRRAVPSGTREKYAWDTRAYPSSVPRNSNRSAMVCRIEASILGVRRKTSRSSRDPGVGNPASGQQFIRFSTQLNEHTPPGLGKIDCRVKPTSKKAPRRPRE